MDHDEVLAKTIERLFKTQDALDSVRNENRQAAGKLSMAEKDALTARLRLSETEKVIDQLGVTVERVATLFDAIAHGDADHRSWLKGAIAAHFAGDPVPAPK